MGCIVSNPSSRYAASSGGKAEEDDFGGLAAALDTADDKPAAFTVEVEVDSAREEKLHIVQDVYIFKHLSGHQLRLLVDSMRLASYEQGAKVIEEGAVGDSFYVMADGEVEVTIGSKKIRNLGKRAYFGERALLFDEPRTATISVVSRTAEAWCIDKPTFLEVVKGKMLQQLMHRIRLQDTSVTLEDLQSFKRIGEGAAGTVDLVQHCKTQTRYALKTVKKQDGKLPTEVEREIDLLKMNDHPFVLQLVKTFETEDSAYLLTELITGGELHAAIRTIPTVLSTPQALFYGGSLALALEALHSRRIIYRDLKPENAMLDHQGYLKIIDFGIARKLDTDQTRTFTMVGTPHYMAPEVMKGRGYNRSVDFWSLGVIIFELVCGYLPFANDHEEAQEVFLSVIHGTVEFPSFYKDPRGHELLSGLLCHNAKKRLGANHFDEIKKAPWFLAAQKPSGAHLFDQLMGRELDPPVVPAGEVFSTD